jgi:hypothetical protein
LAVVLVHITPIACDMPNEAGQRIVTRCPERFQSTGRGDDLTGLELDP